MTSAGPFIVFDGHNDVLLDLRKRGRSFFERSEEGHIDLPRAHEGGFGGGFCAVFVPSSPPLPEEGPGNGPGEVRNEEPPDLSETAMAQKVAIDMMGTLFRIEQESRGQVKIIQTADDLDTCLREGVFAALLHLEGAEAIDTDLNALHLFYRAGLRSLGLVWSRSNAFGHGVPFRFPHSPDTGPGLTEAGRELVRCCNGMRITLDLSHLNERGFWDVAGITDAPLVATHSNAHALCPSTRNLTDRQLSAIRESDGMVGVNFCVGFLREDGGSDPETSLETIVRHVDYLVERLGIERVGFGSDFDGAGVPRAIRDVTGLPRVLDTLRLHGYDESSLRKLAHENWLRVLRKTWGA